MQDKVYASIPSAADSDDPRRLQIDEWSREARELARSEPGQALTLARDTLKFARELAYRRGEAKALLAVAICHSLSGDFDSALNALDEAKEIIEALDDARLRASRENILCFYHYNRGDQRLALEAAFRSVTLWREMDDHRELVKPLVNLSSQLINTGRENEAIAYLNEALELTHQEAQPSARSIVLSNIGIIHLRKGDFPLAVAYLEEAVGVMEAEREYQNAVLNLYHLTDAYLELGRTEQGEATAEHAFQMAKEFGQPQSQLLALRAQAAVLLRREDYVGALRILRRAIRLSRKRHVTYDAAGLLNQAAACLRASGKPRAARRALQEAVTLASESGDRLALAEARLRLSETCAEVKDFAGAYENYRAYHDAQTAVEKEESRQRTTTQATLWEIERQRLEATIAERDARIENLQAICEAGREI